MDAESRSSRWLPWLVSGGASLLVLASWVHANRAGAVGAPPLAGVGPLADAWIRAGGALVGASGRVIGVLRLPVLLGLALWLGQRLRRRQSPGSTAGLCAALALGWLAQSYLLDLQVALGLALYGAAAGVYLWRRPAPQAFAERMPPGAELGAALLLLALFAFVCLYRLDVHPPLDFDEIAYLKAARMTLGEVPPSPLGAAFGGHAYSLERFQAQVVPHALQVAAVSVLAPGILQIRLVALLCGVAALVVTYLTLRRWLGARSALVGLGLACAAPVLLAHSRPGLYLAVSIPHGALCLACLMQLHESWSRRWALALGVLLGSSVYLYQVSWFVPVFALGAALTLLPELVRRPHAVSMAVATLVPAALLLVPVPLVLESGFRQIGSQTFGRGATKGSDVSAIEFLVSPSPVDEASLRELLSRLEESGLRAHHLYYRGGVSILGLRGPAEPMRSAVEDLERDLWKRIPPSRALWHFPLHMLTWLFYANPEPIERTVKGPLLNPLLAPLLVLGVLEALRRRREPLMRILLVWTAGAAVAPAVLGDVVPRRTILMFPFAAGLMVLPLREVTRGFRGSGAAFLASLAVLAAMATGHHLYFERWYFRSPVVPGAEAGQGEPWAPPLELARLVRALPRQERILMPHRLLRGPDPFFDLIEEPRGKGQTGRIFLVERASSPAVVRRSSCRFEPPFSWIFLDTPEHEKLAKALKRAYQVESRTEGRLRVVRATSLKGSACPRLRRRRR